MNHPLLEQRIPEYPIAEQFITRWSPRSYSGETIDDSTLFSLFEAARWAPSGSNSQPWRFIYAKQGSPEWPTFISFLKDNNAIWTPKAAALVILLSKKTYIPAAETAPKTARNHSFDAGAAWAHLSLQALALGWHTRAMGGYDKEKARATLGIPDDYHLEVTIAIGRRAALESLPEALRAREKPSQRKPLGALVAQGKFDFSE